MGYIEDLRDKRYCGCNITDFDGGDAPWISEERLVTENGSIERKAAHFERAFAMDRELLFRFLRDTRSGTMAALTSKSQSVTKYSGSGRRLFCILYR